MYCEIYIDSLFLFYFCMTFFCLRLVNAFFYCTATLRRVILGAFLGSVILVLMYVLPGGAVLRSVSCLLTALIIMLIVTFRIRHFCSGKRILEIMITLSLLLTTGIVLIRRILLLVSFRVRGVFWIILVGGLITEFLIRKVRFYRQSKKECTVTLYSGKREAKVEALVDTGNSLIEPISKKEVSILDRKVFDFLFSEEESPLFRAIPYHSVGKKKGILQGYLLPRIEVELEGVSREFQNVYIAACPDIMSGLGNYQMILNPRMLEND